MNNIFSNTPPVLLEINDKIGFDFACKHGICQNSYYDYKRLIPGTLIIITYEIKKGFLYNHVLCSIVTIPRVCHTQTYFITATDDSPNSLFNRRLTSYKAISKHDIRNRGEFNERNTLRIISVCNTSKSHGNIYNC